MKSSRELMIEGAMSVFWHVSFAEDACTRVVEGILARLRENGFEIYRFHDWRVPASVGGALMSGFIEPTAADFAEANRLLATPEPWEFGGYLIEGWLVRLSTDPVRFVACELAAIRDMVC